MCTVVAILCMTPVCLFDFRLLDVLLILPACVSTLLAHWIYDCGLLSDTDVCSCLTTLTSLCLELLLLCLINKHKDFTQRLPPLST